MSDLLPALMVWPFLTALALTTILVYFGVHVVGRKVIFVDLAMAQIAALGAAVGGVLGYEIQHSPWGIFAYSLAFTSLGSLIISITKTKSDEVPHEAIIGITYAVAFAVTIIVLSRTPQGPEELARMMKGELLLATWRTVRFPMAVFAVVGVFHLLFRKQFLALSFGPAERLRRPHVWDFFFYASLGLVVTSSVRVAGVFLVFCLLVIPAVGSFLFSRSTAVRLASGWIGGGVLCYLGTRLSYARNWPISSSIVVAFAAALAVAGVVRFVLSSESKRRALAHVAGFSAVFAVAGTGLWLFRHRSEDPFEQARHLAHSASEAERRQALEVFEAVPGRRSEWLPLARAMLSDSYADNRILAARLLLNNHDSAPLREVVKLLRDPESHVRDQCVDLLQKFGDPGVTGELIAAGDQEKLDDPLKIQMYDAALELGDRDSVDRLLDIAANPDAPKRRRQAAMERLKPHVDFPKPLAAATVEECRAWWKERRDRAAWRPADHKFVVE